MQALKTENLELTLDDQIVQMSVNGPMTSETVQSSFEWIENVQSESATNDNLQLCVEMQADNFSDLAEASQQFRRVGEVLRRAHDIDRCALITDSTWIRNSAKIEGAVIPGLELMAFAPENAESAEKWLRDEPLIEEEPETAVMTAQSPQKATELPPSAPAPDTKSGSAWDGFTVKGLDL
jgi:hypothetical protein